MDIRIKSYQALIADVEAEISILANTTAYIMQELDDVSWAGFYHAHHDELILGAFQGKVACTNIAIGKGVCGTVAQTRETLIVPDVHKFPGHIACDAASNSEIVIPLIVEGELYGVLDLDSTSFDRFTEVDKTFLEELSACFVQRITAIRGNENV